MNTFGNIKRGTKQLVASEFQEAGRKIDQSRPALTSGDGMAAERFVGQLGSGPLANDIGKLFYVRITKVGDTEYGDRRPYEFEEVVILYTQEYFGGGTAKEAKVEKVTGGKVARIPENPAFCINDAELSVGDFALARRSLRSPYAWELIPVGSSNDGGFWAKLTEKTPGPCTRYRYERLGSAIGCVDSPTGITGSCQEVNGVDLPVPDPATGGSGSGEDHWPAIIVRLYPDNSDTGSGQSGGGGGGADSGSDGPFCLFAMNPRWEFVYKTDDEFIEIDGVNYYPGILLRYDQTTKELVSMQEVLLLDMTSVFVS